jgi:hypothetical protein
MVKRKSTKGQTKDRVNVVFQSKITELDNSLSNPVYHAYTRYATHVLVYKVSYNNGDRSIVQRSITPKVH